MEFIYLVFTRMPGEWYCWLFSSLFLCLCDVFRALIVVKKKKDKRRKTASLLKQDPNI